MFKVGDIVVGLRNTYLITRQGWKGTVIEVRENSIVLVGLKGSKWENQTFPVTPQYFKLVEPKIKYITDSLYI